MNTNLHLYRSYEPPRPNENYATNGQQSPSLNRRHTTGGSELPAITTPHKNNQFCSDDPSLRTTNQLNPNHVLDRFGFIVNMDSHGNVVVDGNNPSPTTKGSSQQKSTNNNNNNNNNNNTNNRVTNRVQSRLIQTPPTHAESRRNERRIKKWFTMIHSWTPLHTLETKRPRRYKTLLRRSRKGIPDSDRGKIWPVLCGVGLKIHDNPGLYADLVHRSVVVPVTVTECIENSNQGDQQLVETPTLSYMSSTASPLATTTTTRRARDAMNSKDVSFNHTKSFRCIQDTIERDIHRTFPRHCMFVEDLTSHHRRHGSESIIDSKLDSIDASDSNDDNNDNNDEKSNSSDEEDNLLNAHDNNNNNINNNINNNAASRNYKNNNNDDDDIISDHLQKEATSNGLCGTTAEDITNVLRQQLDLSSSTGSKKFDDDISPSASRSNQVGIALETIATSPSSSSVSSQPNSSKNADIVVSSSKKIMKQQQKVATNESTTKNSTTTTGSTSASDDGGAVTPEIVLESRGGQASMRRVLKAYSTYDRQTGYCQGMNFIAGMFLTFMTEEEAFWMLVVIMFEKPCKMRGLFGEGMKETHQVLYVAEKLISQFLPTLAKHFERECVHITMFATQWLLTVYTSSFHFDLVTRVWDSFLVEGWKITYRVMLSILQQYQSDLLQMSFEDILGFFRGLPDRIDGGYIVDEAMKIKLRWSHITKYESEWHEQQQQQQQQQH